MYPEIEAYLRDWNLILWDPPTCRFDVWEIRREATRLPVLRALCDLALGFFTPIDSVPMTHSAVRGFTYPTALRALAEFADVSYGNDTMDSVVFRIDATHYHLWIDAANTGDRSPEYADPLNGDFAPRFALHTVDRAGDYPEISDEPRLCTDDACALLQALGL